jgi:hypothetical protein
MGVHIRAYNPTSLSEKSAFDLLCFRNPGLEQRMAATGVQPTYSWPKKLAQHSRIEMLLMLGESCRGSPSTIGQTLRQAFALESRHRLCLQPSTEERILGVPNELIHV